MKTIYLILAGISILIAIGAILLMPPENGNWGVSSPTLSPVTSYGWLKAGVTFSGIAGSVFFITMFAFGDDVFRDNKIKEEYCKCCGQLIKENRK